MAGEVDAHQAAEDRAERHRGDGVEDLLGESNGPPPYTQAPWRTGTLQLNGEPAVGGSAFRKKKQLFNNNDHIRLFGNRGVVRDLHDQPRQEQHQQHPKQEVRNRGPAQSTLGAPKRYIPMVPRRAGGLSQLRVPHTINVRGC